MATRSFPPPARRFVPETVDAGNWADLEPLFSALEERSIDSLEEFHEWIYDLSELESILRAEEARRYIDMTCHTDDESRRLRFLEYSREIESRSKAAFDRLDRVYLESDFRSQLPEERFEVYDRTKKSDAEIFREANIPLEVQEIEKATEYVKLMGSLTVELNGEEVPFAKAYLELEQPDRSRREAIWRRIYERRYKERDRIEELFSDLFDIRQQIAKNADFASYRDFRFRHFRRFDYTVANCEQFHDAVRSVLVPEICRINEIRRRKLDLDTLRLWDMEVNPYSAEPYRPFTTEKELCDRALARRTRVTGRLVGRRIEDRILAFIPDVAHVLLGKIGGDFGIYILARLSDNVANGIRGVEYVVVGVGGNRNLEGGDRVFFERGAVGAVKSGVRGAHGKTE